MRHSSSGVFKGKPLQCWSKLHSSSIMLAISYFKLPTRQFGNHDKLEPKTVVTCLLNLGKTSTLSGFLFLGAHGRFWLLKDVHVTIHVQSKL